MIKSKIHFRVAMKEDFGSIKRIWVEGLNKSFPSKAIVESTQERFYKNFHERKKPFVYWVALADDIVAWCSILPAFIHPLKAHTDAEVSTYVKTDHKGIGTLLMKHVFDDLYREGEIENVFGFALKENKKSIQMCIKSGMKICGETTKKLILLKEFK